MISPYNLVLGPKIIPRDTEEDKLTAMNGQFRVYMSNMQHADSSSRKRLADHAQGVVTDLRNKIGAGNFPREYEQHATSMEEELNKMRERYGIQ